MVVDRCPFELLGQQRHDLLAQRTTEAVAWHHHNRSDTAFVDVDLDGWLDLAFARDGAPHSVYFNDGGVLDSHAGWTSPGDDAGGNTLDFGDMNHDGWPDLLISDNGQHGGRASSSVYCGPSLERCWENEDFEEGYPSAAAFADPDGDGDLDVVGFEDGKRSWHRLNEDNGSQIFSSEAEKGTSAKPMKRTSSLLK